MNGKGSIRRPLSVDEDTFAANWDRVFGGAKRDILDKDDRARVESKPVNDRTKTSARERNRRCGETKAANHGPPASAPQQR